MKQETVIELIQFVSGEIQEHEISREDAESMLRDFLEDKK